MAAFAIRAAATDVRSVNGSARIAVAPSSRLEISSVVTPELAAYVDLVSLPWRDVDPVRRAAIATDNPDLAVARVGASLSDAASPRAQLARVQLDAVADEIAAVAWTPSATLPEALGALRPLAPILTGDIQAIQGANSSLQLSVEGRTADSVARWLFFDATTFATYLVYEGPEASAPRPPKPYSYCRTASISRRR